MWESIDELKKDLDEIEKRKTLFWDDNLKRRYLHKMLYYVQENKPAERDVFETRILSLIQGLDSTA